MNQLSHDNQNQDPLCLEIKKEIKDLQIAYANSETYEDWVYLDGKMDGLKIALAIIEEGNVINGKN